MTSPLNEIAQLRADFETFKDYVLKKRPLLRIRSVMRVRVATTANITISTALNAGDTLDGVTLADGDIVLVKDHATAASIGIYIVAAVPIRHPEFDTYDPHAGVLVVVEEGTVNADTTWLCTSDKGGTLDTTAIAFTRMLGATGAPNRLASTTDNAAARFDGTTGLLQNSAFIIDDTGHVTSFGGNLAFPATQAASAGANVLDDYEEGTWVPTWTAASSNPSLGDGTFTTHYVKIGQLVACTFTLVPGSTTTFGTGSWSFSLPFTPLSSTLWQGSSRSLDVGTANHIGTTLVSSSLLKIIGQGTADFYGPAIPFTWVSGDVLACSLTYRASA